MAEHSLQRLVPKAVTVVGPTPARDPEFGVVYRILEEIAANYDELSEEIWFDTIELVADPPAVYLALRKNRKKKLDRVATACMTGMHADSRLSIMDADYDGSASGAPGWSPW